MSECPTSEALAGLAAERLSAEAAAAIDAHLETCDRCLRSLMRLLRGTGAATLVPPPNPAAGTSSVASATAAEHYVPVCGADGAEVELGRGGIGRVVLVTDTQLGRDVAMKLLLPARVRGDTQQSAGVEARFLREARVTGQLEHPAIVPVHEVGQRPDGSPFYTMRRIRGRTLAQAIAEAGTLQGRLKLMPHVLAACQAMAFAHSRHVVHRDLKPQNVMLDRFGETYVVDWGLARVRGQEDEGVPTSEAAGQTGALRLAPDLTGAATHAVLGTPAYMAPEQLAGRIGEVDERSDTWGLGAILYELLTGGLPRELESSPGAPLHFGPVRPVLVREPAAPKELAAICDKALAEDPAARYPTAEHLAADVGAWVLGGRVEAYEYRAWDLARRFAHRYRAPLTVAAAALALVAGLAVNSVRRVRAERDDAREMAKLILGDVGDRLAPVAGSLPVVESITRRALDFYERVGAEEDLEPEERAQMALAVMRLWQVNQSLGRLDEAKRLAVLCNTIVGDPGGLARTRPPLLAMAVNCETGLATLAMLQGLDDEFGGHLEEAQRRVRLASSDWDDEVWLNAQSLLASRLFRRAYARDAFPEALEFARRQVALDERALALKSNDRRATIALAYSLIDTQLVATTIEGFDAGWPHGERAVALLLGLPDADDDVKVLAALATAATQQHRMLMRYRGTEAAQAMFTVARRASARLLALEPDSIEILSDYAGLLLHNGDLEGAWALYLRADALGADGPDYEASLAETALLIGKPEVVLERRASLERAGTPMGRRVLALALAFTGDLPGAAAMARLIAEESATQPDWPPGLLQRHTQTIPGAVGRAAEAFADDFERLFAQGPDQAPEQWKLVFERLAAALEAIAADGGSAPQR